MSVNVNFVRSLNYSLLLSITTFIALSTGTEGYKFTTRFQERSHADSFIEILHKQDPAIKYTVEFEDQKHSLDFLDINITSNTTNKKHKFKVHWKDAITNIYIKPISCIDPSINKSVFKGFLHLAPTVCPKTYIKEETVFSRHACWEWT